MRPAIWGGDGIAIIAIAALRPERPSNSPFNPALFVGEFLIAAEEISRHTFPITNLLTQMVCKAAGELENRFCRRVIRDEGWCAFPANFNACKEIGFRAGQLEQTARLKAHLAKNLSVWGEADTRAAAIIDRPQLFQRTKRLSARKALAEQFFVPSDFNDSVCRQCIDDGNANAVQAA